MNLEKLFHRALNAAEEMAKSPVSDRIKAQMEKGLEGAAALSQNLPSQEQIAQMIEEKSPHLAQTFLNVASEVSNPHQVGMGLKILDLSDEGIRVLLPNRWRNRTQSGALHAGALMTLAEYAGRSYWERLVDRNLGDVRLVEVRANYMKNSYRDVFAQFHFAGEQRERVLFELRSQGRVVVDTSIIIFGKDDQRIADFTLVWDISSPLVLENQSENQRETMN